MQRPASRDELGTQRAYGCPSSVRMSLERGETNEVREKERDSQDPDHAEPLQARVTSLDFTPGQRQKERQGSYGRSS